MGESKNIEYFSQNDNKHKSIKILIQALLSVLAIASYPALFLYFQNADEARFSEIALPLFVFITIGTILYTITYIVVKSTSKAAIISNLFIFVLLNYSLLENGIVKIFPTLRYWHVFPIFVYIIFHFAGFIYKKFSEEISNTTVIVLSIVFCGLIFLNGIIAAPSIIKKNSFGKAVEQKDLNLIDSKDRSQPNLYYLLLDEYSSINFMKKYYNYDNSTFAEFLETAGFNVSYTSHNESIITTTIVTNYMNLDYVVSNYNSEAEKEYLRHNSLLFKLLRENGYSITGIGDAHFFGLENAAKDIKKHYALTIKGETLKEILWKNTVVYPFINNSYSESAKNILDAVEYIKNLKYPSNSSQFVLFYIKPSHPPFLFDENGNMLKSGFTNWTDKKFYLGTYIYTTKVIKDVVKSILISDPDSIIIIQSDHSARASSDLNLFMEIFGLEDMNNFFNAVYFRGEHFDINGLSGVNTWRKVIGDLFSKNYEEVEVPIDEFKYK